MDDVTGLQLLLGHCRNRGDANFNGASLTGLTQLPDGLERVSKKENNQNLTSEIMNWSNQVHL